MKKTCCLLRTLAQISLLALLLFSSNEARALTTATVATSLTATPVCPIFSDSNLDYAVSIFAGVKLYTGNLDTATWSTLGSASSSYYSRNIRCSRDQTGTTHSVYNRTAVPSAGNYLKHVRHDSAGVPVDTNGNGSVDSNDAITVDATLSDATPLAAMHDSSDNLYVLFSSGTHYHLAYLASGTITWTTYDIDTSGNMGGADMVLVNDLPIVALYDSVNDDVIISRADATLTAWTTETAVSTGSIGDNVSLDADANGNLHVFYHNASGGNYYSLEYATNSSGSWAAAETVDGSGTYLYSTDIEIASSNIVVTTAYSQMLSSVVYFTRTASGWSAAQTVAAASHQFLDLGLDGGDVAISYFDSSNALQVAYSLCGDGSQSDVEECDDGNNTDGDGCDAICVVEVLCGDGFPQGTEVCDDGNTDNTDGCTNTCQAASCGDSYVQLGEECDDANTDNGDSCVKILNPDGTHYDCRSATCGDGQLWNTDGGTEACDDGNMNNKDGCGSDCQIEHVPSANAGVDQTVNWPAGPAPTVNLSGTAADPDAGATLTYRWIFASRPPTSVLTNAAITSRNTLTPSFLPDVDGIYTLQLTVVDNVYYSASDSAVVTVTR